MPGTTIAAISSPPGSGQRGVLRLSGPETREIVGASCRLEDCTGSLPPSRRVLRGELDDVRGSQPLLLLWMPGPHSYTREDVAELHLPGSPPLLEAALARVLELGARMAQPGEFTRRAFEHGRLDLSQAEGVLALVGASNEAERRSAAALLFGGLGSRVESLRSALVDLRALCEASLDFDETDTGHVAAEELERLAGDVALGLDEAATWEERREPLSGLPRVALVGRPNAGKSSLFNALTGATDESSQGALVSGLAGTTRDALSSSWTLGGVRCRLADTAGLERVRTAAEGDDPDLRAQVLASVEHASAELLLWVVDVTAARGAEDLGREHGALPAATPTVLVWSKIDRAESAGFVPAVPVPSGLESVVTSAATGLGLDDLERAAARALGFESPGPGGATKAGEVGAAPRGDEGLGRELSLRHRDALERAREGLAKARALLAGGAQLDLVAGELRAATDALDAISGRTTPEQILDRIFARFCIGK